jgi:hypothetical protein
MNDSTGACLQNEAPPTARLRQASLAQVLAGNVCSPLPVAWRKAQWRDHQRPSRRYLLPLIKPLSVALIWGVKLIKRVWPWRLGSERLLNRLSVWFVPRCLSPEAQEMLLRHLAIENALVQFVARNCGAPAVLAPYLRPAKGQDLGDTQGMNTTLMHDTIILNFFADLGHALPQGPQPPPRDDLVFSDLGLPRFEFTSNRINLDAVSAIYLVSLFLVILFDENTLESSVQSLYLDDSLMSCLAQLTGDTSFQQWSPGPFVDVMRFPLDVADLLLKHIKICEYAYAHLIRLEPTGQFRISEGVATAQAPALSQQSEG